MTSTARTFHRRPLPAPGIAFSSALGRQMFAEALELKSVGCFFRLIEQFHTQQEPAFCGLGTLAMVLNALGVDPERVWKGPWRWFSESLLDCCEPLEDVKQRGITFSKVACLARCNGAQVAAHRVDEPEVTIEEFRKAVAATCQADPDDGDLQVLVVSYSRKQLKQTGDGHYSPVGGYHPGSDHVLILDVARFKYPPHWVPLTELWAAMGHKDPDTGRSRGFMIMRSSEAFKSSRLELMWRWPQCSEEAKNAAATMVGCGQAFAQALLTEPLDGAPLAAATEVLRRALAFIESPLMPLTVVYKVPSGTEAWGETCKEVEEALACFVDSLDRALGTNCFARPGQEDWSPTLAAANVLAIEPGMWRRVLGPNQVDEREARAKAAWEVLQPLLQEVPERIRKDVQLLRCQWADLLTAREAMCGAACGRRETAGGSCCAR